MLTSEYYHSGRDPASSHDSVDLLGYSQHGARPRTSANSSLHPPIHNPSYAAQTPDSSTLGSSFTYPQPSFTDHMNYQQLDSSWNSQGQRMTDTSSAMDPSHLFLPATGADSMFAGYDLGSDGAYIDRCNSPCPESCQSQCGEDGEADVCCDPNCDEIAGFCTDDSCVDQVSCSPDNCPVIELPEGVEDAAAALASIGSREPAANPPVDGALSSQAQTSLRLTTPATPQSSVIPQSPFFTPQYPGLVFGYFMPQPMMMTFYPSMPEDLGVNLELMNDLITHHNPQQQSSHSAPHFRPCPLDNAPLLTRRCMLPRGPVYPEAGARQQLGQVAEGGNGCDMLPDACGAWLSGPDDVLPHMANDHPHAFDTLQSYLSMGGASLQAGLGLGAGVTRGAALAQSIEAPGSARLGDDSSLFEAYSTTPSSTPHGSATPLTQGSDATLDTVDMGPQLMCKWQDDTGICGQSFDDAEGLHQHILTHSRAVKKLGGGHRCRWAGCSRPEGEKGCFPQRTKLERHLQTHTGFKPAECAICGLALSGAQALAQHMRTHTNETPWKCDFEGCGKEFKQQSALTMHKRTHTDEKPLECNICGKRFSESSNLSKHKKIHTRSFRCLVCGKDFSRADQLRKHERLHEEAGGEPGAGVLSKTLDGRVGKGKKVKAGV